MTSVIANAALDGRGAYVKNPDEKRICKKLEKEGVVSIVMQPDGWWVVSQVSETPKPYSLRRDYSMDDV